MNFNQFNRFSHPMTKISTQIAELLILSCPTFEFCTVPCNTNLVEMAVLASKNLTTAKKLPLVGLDLMQELLLA